MRKQKEDRQHKSVRIERSIQLITKNVSILFFSKYGYKTNKLEMTEYLSHVAGPFYFDYFLTTQQRNYLLHYDERINGELVHFF